MTQNLIITAEVTSVRDIEEILRDSFRVNFTRSYSNVWQVTEDALQGTAFESLEQLMEDLVDALAYQVFEMELIEEVDSQQIMNGFDCRTR